MDFVRGADHRFEKLTVEKGLLRETEAVQQQIQQLLKCDVSSYFSIYMACANVYR